jgi:hypothetical protein
MLGKRSAIFLFRIAAPVFAGRARMAWQEGRTFREAMAGNAALAGSCK